MCPAVSWVHNPRWLEGLGTSLATGAVAIRPESNGLMVLLCDLWRIQTKDLLVLAEAWQSDPERIVAAMWKGQSMPPVIFPSSCLKQIRSLSGHQGAKTLLKDQAERVTAIPMKNAIYDIDTPADLHEFMSTRR